MSGHSKWANIKHSKGKADAAKAKVFARIAKEIMVVARNGGANPDANLRLKALITKAREQNMPNENIQRAIQRGSGQLEGVSYEELVYEGYGPAGVAILLEALTDNRNRTAGELRHIFDKYGGNLGETGSVSWVFERKGLLVIDRSEYSGSEDDMLEMALEAGAEDLRVTLEAFEIVTAPEEFEVVESSLIKAGFSFLHHEITQLPKNTVVLTDPEEIQKVERLLEMLDNCDDVQNIYDNSEVEA
ncbi:MAG: YebC/PmpR family DNA-binding transcriptional regulator [Symbiobacteriaceae bacterium]|nr:YebC/PmpR family DNA-binding transcriptional regulator [Symbiobacteriaceae bacterium]